MDLDPAVQALVMGIANDLWNDEPQLRITHGELDAIVATAYPIIAASVARATADAIADPARWALEQMQRERAALFQQGLNGSTVYGYDKCIELVESALAAFGRTPETDTTEATE